MQKIGKELYGRDVGLCLLDIGWSSNELARRLGTTPVIINRILAGQGRTPNQRLTVAESESLLRLAEFIRTNKLPRRENPSRT